jgi:hypothetical protein
MVHRSTTQKAATDRYAWEEGGVPPSDAGDWPLEEIVFTFEDLPLLAKKAFASLGSLTITSKHASLSKSPMRPFAQNCCLALLNQDEQRCWRVLTLLPLQHPNVRQTHSDCRWALCENSRSRTRCDSSTKHTIHVVDSLTHRESLPILVA